MASWAAMFGHLSSDVVDSLHLLIVVPPTESSIPVELVYFLHHVILGTISCDCHSPSCVM